MIIYVAGNRLYGKDNLPFRILPLLKKEFPYIIFGELDPSESLPSKNLIIIDTVVGIGGVRVFSDLESFFSQKIYSPHDYDFLFELKLNKKLGRLGRMVIIGVSPDLSEKEAFEKITSEIKKLI